jgi:hypothetical protein
MVSIIYLRLTGLANTAGNLDHFSTRAPKISVGSVFSVVKTPVATYDELILFKD